MDNNTNAFPQKGVSQMREVAGNTGQLGGRQGYHPEGLYRHPNGAELITQNDPLLGDAQGRAAERLGFVYVGPAPEGAVKTLGAPSEVHAAQPERKLEGQSEELKGVLARLNALEAENARLKAAPGPEVVGAEETKQAAADKVEQTSEDYRQLQAEAKELGLNAKGSREELTQRIAEAKAEKENK